MKRRNYIVIFSCIIVIMAILSLNNISSPSPIHKVSYFSFIDQYDDVFTTNKLKGKITIADFFFTSCPVICPRMSEKMKELAEIYKNDENIQFLSISVDPINDSKEVINNYINTRNLNYSNWYFLQTDSSISSLLPEGFLLSGENLPGMHPTKFILINYDGEIVGYYDPAIDSEFNILKNNTTYLLNS